MKCKSCKYYEKAVIHGHGEYYGTCKVAYNLLKQNGYKYLMNKWTIKDDEEECPIVEVMERTLIPDYQEHH